MKTFKQYIEEDMNKTLHITRGVPGSGKSFTISKIVPKGNILSTDDFWGKDYNFDVSKIGSAHRWNQTRAGVAMKDGITPIAIDNTNLTWKEIKPYYNMAKENGYIVKYVESQSPWWKEISAKLNDPKFKNNEEELNKIAEFLGSKNVHGVPIETIKKMLIKWTPTDQLPK